MKYFYVKVMLFVCAFALSANANAAEKKLPINPATFTKLQIGNKIGDNYEITGIYAKQVKKGPKTATNDWIPKEGWEPYVGPNGTSAGNYIRTNEDHGLVDPGEIHCNIYTQKMAENPDTSYFKIEDFFVLRHRNLKDTTKIDTTYVSLYFKCNTKTGQCVVPVQDMDLFISVINNTTGDTYELECYLGDVPESLGYPKKYYEYYPCQADLGYGLFTFNIYYFCEMGGFGLSEEKFLMDGSKPEWTEWTECGTAEYIHGLMVDEEEGETGLQEDIVVYKRIYNPDPRVCEYWFEEWGSGYWTRSGVDFIVHINADGTITVPEQLTGGTELDEETEEEFDVYVLDVVSFNPDTFLPEFCSSTFDVATKTGTIWPCYFWRPNPESTSVTGYFGIYPDETQPNGFDYRFSDVFTIHETAPQGLAGDADEDGEVTVADITAIAAYILGNTPEKFNITNADVDVDGEITVADITGTAGIILGN